MVAPVALSVAELWIEFVFLVIDTAGVGTGIKFLLEAFEAVVAFIAVIGAVPGSEVIFNAAKTVFLAVALSTSSVAGVILQPHFILQD